jgi:OOP family OmpA-OmpF porin
MSTKKLSNTSNAAGGTGAAVAALAIGLAALIAGCATQEAPKSEPAPAPAPVEAAPAPKAAPVQPPAAPKPQAQPAAPAKPAVISLSSTELFEFNKAALTKAARTTLDNEVVAKLRDLGNIRYVNVNGHADRLGSAPYNQKLSERRAQAVKAYLVSKGADAAKIEVFGFGKTMPVKACPDQKNRKELIECLAPNRRVVVEIQGAPR